MKCLRELLLRERGSAAPSNSPVDSSPRTALSTSAYPNGQTTRPDRPAAARPAPRARPGPGARARRPGPPAPCTAPPDPSPASTTAPPRRTAGSARASARRAPARRPAGRRTGAGARRRRRREPAQHLQQPFTGQRPPCRIRLHPGGHGSPPGGDQQGAARLRSRGPAAGPRPDLQPLVDRLVQRYQHPFLDLGPVPGPGTGRCRPVVPDERRCHRKRAPDLPSVAPVWPPFVQRTPPVCQATPPRRVQGSVPPDWHAVRTPAAGRRTIAPWQRHPFSPPRRRTSPAGTRI